MNTDELNAMFEEAGFSVSNFEKVYNAAIKKANEKQESGELSKAKKYNWVKSLVNIGLRFMAQQLGDTYTDLDDNMYRTGLKLVGANPRDYGLSHNVDSDTEEEARYRQELKDEAKAANKQKRDEEKAHAEEMWQSNYGKAGRPEGAAWSELIASKGDGTKESPFMQIYARHPAQDRNHHNTERTRYYIDVQDPDNPSMSTLYMAQKRDAGAHTGEGTYDKMFKKGKTDPWQFFIQGAKPIWKHTAYKPFDLSSDASDAIKNRDTVISRNKDVLKDASGTSNGRVVNLEDYLDANAILKEAGGTEGLNKEVEAAKKLASEALSEDLANNNLGRMHAFSAPALDTLTPDQRERVLNKWETEERNPYVNWVLDFLTDSNLSEEDPARAAKDIYNSKNENAIARNKAVAVNDLVNQLNKTGDLRTFMNSRYWRTMARSNPGWDKNDALRYLMRNGYEVSESSNLVRPEGELEDPLFVEGFDEENAAKHWDKLQEAWKKKLEKFPELANASWRTISGKTGTSRGTASTKETGKRGGKTGEWKQWVIPGVDGGPETVLWENGRYTDAYRNKMGLKSVSEMLSDKEASKKALEVGKSRFYSLFPGSETEQVQKQNRRNDRQLRNIFSTYGDQIAQLPNGQDLLKELEQKEDITKGKATGYRSMWKILGNMSDDDFNDIASVKDPLERSTAIMEAASKYKDEPKKNNAKSENKTETKQDKESTATVKLYKPGKETKTLQVSKNITDAIANPFGF